MASGLKPNPVRKYGGRDLDCPFYDDCLDRAAIPNWRTFCCEECPMYHPETATSPAVGQLEPALPPTFNRRPAFPASDKPPTADAGISAAPGAGNGPVPASAITENTPPTPEVGDPGSVKSAAPASGFTRQTRKEEPVPETPKCRNHPDRPAKLRTDGISTGLCQECLDAKNERARQARAASGSKPGGPKQAATGQSLTTAQAIKQLAMMAPVLKGRANAMRQALTKGDNSALIADAQGVLAVLDIMGETGVLPGWAEK